tara:strand:+ start:527 stop:1384 length:858 start_codon:yes stop_codon:yes gene_type:complete
VKPNNEVILMDGAMGTQLIRKGVSIDGSLWSAQALLTAPNVVEAIHAAYAKAGATVHSANTFRTSPWSLAKAQDSVPGWQELTKRALQLARKAVAVDHLVAGCIAPLEDCYRPDLSPEPKVCQRQHRIFAEGLAEAGADLLLCETFTQPNEALIAVEAAAETGLPVWLSLSAGPNGELLSAQAICETLIRAADLGAAALLINCSPISLIEDVLMQCTTRGLRLGAYANLGRPDPTLGWRTDGLARPATYAKAAARWLSSGACIIGGCCGAGPEHIRELAGLRPTP